jgi:acyl-CoA reductase-like NAD-dependent aldehyde dehydrogenase
VITIIPAASEQDALEIANDTEHGLSSAVFTRVKASGIGRFGGHRAIEEFTTDH